jgi:hypothetical protein
VSNSKDWAVHGGSNAMELAGGNQLQGAVFKRGGSDELTALVAAGKT